MKIVLLSPLPPPAGGIASWTQRLLSSDIAREHKIYVVNTAVTGKRVQQLNKRSIIGEIKRFFRIRKDLKKVLQDIEPDIVHLNTSCGELGLVRDYFLARLIKRYRSKVLLHCRCDVSYQVSTQVGHIFYRKIARISDTIVVLNTASEVFTMRVANENSIILPHFIMEESIPDITLNKIIKDKIEKVIFVGHVTKAKGCDLILKVAECLPNIIFSLYGYISDEIANLSKPNNVILKGEVSPEEIINEFSNSDLFLFPTLTEGFPMALLEAMAHGMPCVATNVGAIPDMLEGKGGIVLKQGRIDDFVDAIEVLNNSHELRTKMSRWNKEKVLNHYTQDIVIKRINQIYEDLLGRDQT